MRGQSNHHLIAEDHGEAFKDAGYDWRYLAVCGEQFSWTGGIASGPDNRRCCRKCHAAFYAHKLTAFPNGLTLGKTLTDDEKEALGKKYTYRYVYPITDEAGNEWGFLGLPGGWGEAWRLIPWHIKLSDDDDAAPVFQIGHPLSTGSGGELSFASKESALWCLPEMFAERSIKPKAEMLTAKIEARRKHREEQAQWNRERSERAAARDRQREIDAARTRDMTAALTEIRDIFGAALTNFQADGLAEAIKRLGGDAP